MLIGEIARRTGVSARMLRHYDRIGLLSPSERSDGDYRLYTEADVERLFHVESLRSLGLSLAEVGNALDDDAFASTELVERLIENARDRLKATTELLSRLDRVRASDPRGRSDVLRIIELIHGFDSDSASERQRLALSLDEGDERNTAVLVEAFLREEEPNSAGAVLWSLAQIGDAAVPALAEALVSDHPQRRLRALEALMKIGTRRAVASVAAQTRHPDEAVRARANITAGLSGDGTVVDALVAQVAAGVLDMEASDALEALSAQEGITVQLARASAEAVAASDADGRRRLVGMLASVSGDDAESMLMALTADPDAAVALTARAHVAVRRAGQ